MIRNNLTQVSKALANIKVTLNRYEGQGCLRGELSAETQASLICGMSSGVKREHIFFKALWRLGVSYQSLGGGSL